MEYKEPTQEQKLKLAEALKKKFLNATPEELKAEIKAWSELIILIKQSLRK